jgi:hypothetical protein
MFYRRKQRRLFTEVIREQTTSHFYSSIQEATSNLLLNLMRAPEDFLAHITMYVLLHKLVRPSYFVVQVWSRQCLLEYIWKRRY